MLAPPGHDAFHGEFEPQSVPREGGPAAEQPDRTPVPERCRLQGWKERQRDFDPSSVLEREAQRRAANHCFGGDDLWVINP